MNLDREPMLEKFVWILTVHTTMLKKHNSLYRIQKGNL